MKGSGRNSNYTFFYFFLLIKLFILRACNIYQGFVLALYLNRKTLLEMSTVSSLSRCLSGSELHYICSWRACLSSIMASSRQPLWRNTILRQKVPSKAHNPNSCLSTKREKKTKNKTHTAHKVLSVRPRERFLEGFRTCGLSLRYCRSSSVK